MANGGGVAAGGTVASLQSTGVLGTALTTKAAIGGLAGSATLGAKQMVARVFKSKI